MKSIKERPAGGKPHAVESKETAHYPKAAMRQALLKGREQVQSSLTDGTAPRQEGSYTEADQMEQQLQTGVESATGQSIAAAYGAGKKLAQRRAEQRRTRDAAWAAEEAAASVPQPEVPAAVSMEPNPASQPVAPVAGGVAPETEQTAPRPRHKKPAPKARKALRVERPPLRRAGGAAPVTEAAKAVQRQQEQGRKLAIRAAQISKQAAERTAKTVAAAVRRTVELAIAALQSLVTAIAAGGTVALVIILLICFVALVAGSAYGIFFAAESPDGTSMTVQEAVVLLGNEHRDFITEIENTVPHDRQEIVANDDVYYIRWQDVLAVYSSRLSGADDGAPVAYFDERQLDQLRETMWDMNAVDYTTYTETVEVPAADAAAPADESADEGGEDGEDADEDEESTAATITQTVLKIELTHKTAEEMAAQYAFNARQNEYLTLLCDAEADTLWGELLGGFVEGGGEIMVPDGGLPLDYGLQWPLPMAGSITSPFGYRTDPLTGEVSYHSGTDIAAPNGTPILAAAAGTVTVANALDSWGGSYGFYVKIDHGNGIETLYAHCSAICVTEGEQVQAGQVIAYVGSTGRSTGNHLHFEIFKDGVGIGV